MKKYPDMTKLFALKEERRHRLARLPIAEKMEIAQRLQEIGRHSPGYVKTKRRDAKWKVTSQPKKQRVA